MTKKSVSLLASLLLLLPLLTLAADTRKSLEAKSIDSKKTLPNSVETRPTETGGYYPQNATAPYIKELGNFAVDEHNRQTGDHLNYPEVYEAASQVVAGINYKLKLWATNGGLRGNYLTVVFVDLNKIRHLTSFDPIP